jgi:hypothetical protein
MSFKGNPSDDRPNEAVFRRVSSLLIAAMIACAAMTAGILFNQFLSYWNPWTMAVLCFFIALDSLYTRQRIKNQPSLGSSWLVVSGTQIVMIFLVVKVAMSLSRGVKYFLSEIPLWSQDFYQNFITFELLAGLVLAVIAWFVGSYFGELLDAMGMEQALIDQSIEVPDERSQPNAHNRLVSLIFSILIILVMFAALVRVDLTGIQDFGEGIKIIQMPPLSGGGASTLAYFMLGLALLSQTQFISLHTHWGLTRIPVSGNLAGRWALYSILFLILLAIIAGLLPTHYSMGFFSTLGYWLDFLLSILFFIGQVIFSLFVLLINLPFLLLGKEAPLAKNAPASPEIPTPPALEVAITTSVPWLGMVKTIFFWLFFLGVVIFTLSQYLRQHEEVIAGLRRIPGWKYLARFRSWLQSLFAGMGRKISRITKSGREWTSALNASRRFIAQGGYINPKRLTPRQKIYFYYLALIRRGGEQGIPRQPAQTPWEYARTLDRALPTAEDDIDQLTDAFVEARYSRHAVGNEDANRVKKTWEKIRRALQGKDKPHPN